MKLKDICKQHTIVGKDGVNYCDTENCPFAKRDLGIDFRPTDHYSCIADYPYLKEHREAELLKKFVEYIKQSWQEEINTYERLQKEESCSYIASEAIKSKLIGMRKMLGLLDSDIEKFLEEEK